MGLFTWSRQPKRLEDRQAKHQGSQRSRAEGHGRRREACESGRRRETREAEQGQTGRVGAGWDRVEAEAEPEEPRPG